MEGILISFRLITFVFFRKIQKMKEIKMVDLNGQYEKIKTEIDGAIKRVLDSAAFIKGPEVKTFEGALASYLGAGKVISCANGTDALQIALMALGLKPGDEVITTPFTFVATVEVVKLLGLVPVFADIDPASFNIDIRQVESKITSRTKAIVPVHLFGQCADMEKLGALASKHGLYVIEDAAQSLGCNYIFSNGKSKKSGTIGHIGCTSFFPSKNLGTYGDGGALFTDDPDLALKLQAIVNHGMIQRYHYDYVGVNSRLDTLQAAILNVKLRYLDEYNDARKKAAEFYDNALGELEGISIPKRTGFSDHIFHQYTVRVGNGKREALRIFLEKSSVPSMIYYPLTLHLQKAYSDLGYKKGDFPESEKASEEVLSLPMHTELDADQLHFITERIIEFVN
jgi:UDP-2-acetamido-2-deoxy-ribo-hexuluronate aminotransferase